MAQLLDGPAAISRKRTSVAPFITTTGTHFSVPPPAGVPSCASALPPVQKILPSPRTRHECVRPTPMLTISSRQTPSALHPTEQPVTEDGHAPPSTATSGPLSVPGS